MSFKAQRAPFSNRDGNSFQKSQRSHGNFKSDRKAVKVVYLPKQETSTQNVSEENENHVQLQPEVTDAKVFCETYEGKENLAAQDNTFHWENVEETTETTENPAKAETNEKTETDEKTETCQEKSTDEKPAEASEVKSQKKRIRKKKDAKDQANNENEAQQETNLQVTGVKSNGEGARVVEEETKELPPQKKGKKAANGGEKRKSSEEEGNEKLDETQKKIRNAKKKLKQIELLEEKKRKGETLTEEEMAKLRSKKDILILIKDLSIK